MNTFLKFSIAGLTLAVGACRSSDKSGATTDSTTARGVTAGRAAGAGDTGGMQGMGNMKEMAGMESGAMMQQMQAQMRAMMGASADRQMDMLPMHRQMVANMLAQMNAEMRRMNVAGDPAWNATVDSVRQDLVRMRVMSPAELQRFMRAHQQRVMRLMAMHQRMMEGRGVQ